MTSEKSQDDYLMASLEARHGKLRLESRLTNSEIESLKQLKKQRAEQFRKLYQNETIIQK